MVHRTIVSPLLLGMTVSCAIACGDVDRDPLATFETGIDPMAGSPSTGDTARGDTGAAEATGDSTTGHDSPSTGEDSGALKLDVGPAEETGGVCVGAACEQTGCTAVDLLFVIDNSASMQPYQEALASAFPSFAQAIVEGLDPGVNLHVGVTSTEMGYSSSGANSMEFVNGQAVSCTATGDGGAPSESFYTTPDASPTATNGAQGRLYSAGGLRYFDIDADAPPKTVSELEAWFSAAAQIGEHGSQVEMSAAAAAWATDPSNAASNAGFLRDEGAVLVIFFVQDEHDQTPQSETSSILERIDAAKAACGGFDCVVGGGFVNEDCLGLTPLGALFDAFGGQEVVTETLPDPAAVTPMTFESALRDTLAQVIIDTCDEIEPPA